MNNGGMIMFLCLLAAINVGIMVWMWLGALSLSLRHRMSKASVIVTIVDMIEIGLAGMSKNV